MLSLPSQAVSQCHPEAIAEGSRFSKMAEDVRSFTNPFGAVTHTASQRKISTCKIDCTTSNPTDWLTSSTSRESRVHFDRLALNRLGNSSRLLQPTLPNRAGCNIVTRSHTASPEPTHQICQRPRT